MTGCELPTLTKQETADLTRLLVESYFISHLQLMENGGRSLAELARRLLNGDIADRSITILAGRRGCGGTGLVAARHLHNWGAWIHVVTSHPLNQYAGLSAFQLAALQAAEVAPTWAENGWELPPSDLIIDTLIGTGLASAPHGTVRDLIQLANSSQAPVLSLDLPSGMDADTGHLSSPHIVAAATMAPGVFKRGLCAKEARPASGDLYLADIGIPPAVYEKLNLALVMPFWHDTIVRIE